MIAGGNATLYVSSLDAAIEFYTATLGFTLTNRFGSQWATLDAGPSYWTESSAGLTIGLHPASPKHPAPGTPGGVGFGLETYMPAEEVAARLTERRVRITSEIIRYEGGNCFMLEDADGTPTYINEFPPHMLPRTDLGEPAGDVPEPPPTLVSGGHAIVYVSNMDAAVRFYTGTLGLRLTYRFEDRFATAEAGNLVLAIHPQTPRTPAPGRKGSVALGLQVHEPMDRVISQLAERGVRMTGDRAPRESGAVVEIEDEDGNPIYLWRAEAASSRVAAAR